MRYSKSKHLNSFKNLVSSDWKPQLRFKCNCARPIHESWWYSMQSHSINNSRSHTKVCRPRPTLEVNLEQSVSKQSICSFLLQEQYHQIKAQACQIYYEFCTGEGLSASHTLSVPKYLAHQWMQGGCNHWSRWFSILCDGVFLQASLSAPINSHSSLLSSQGTFPPFRLLEELAKAGQPPHRARACSETNLPHSGQPPFSPSSIVAGGSQMARRHGFWAWKLYLWKLRAVWERSCCNKAAVLLLPHTAAIHLLLSNSHGAPNPVIVPGDLQAPKDGVRVSLWHTGYWRLLSRDWSCCISVI